jgi:hypothetical protein
MTETTVARPKMAGPLRERLLDLSIRPFVITEPGMFRYPDPNWMSYVQPRTSSLRPP